MSNSPTVQTLQESHEGLRGIDWVHGLARAGVRRSQGELSVRLYALAQELDEVEQQIESTMTADKFYFKLPTAWWAWVPLLFAFGFLYAAQGDFYERRLVLWASALALFFVFAAFFWLRHRTMEAIRLEKKRRNRPRLKSDKHALVAELLSVRDELVVQIQTSDQEGRS